MAWTRGRTLALLGCFLGGLAHGCTKDGTEIVLSIASDMRIPLELDGLRVDITHVARRIIHNYPLDPSRADHVKLPATLGLVAGAYSDKPILITVTGQKGSKDLVQRRARLPWLKGRILLLRMNLLRSCALRSPPCPPDKTCTEEGCQPLDLDPATLPDYTPELALLGMDTAAPDAGVDGPSGPDSKPTDTGGADSDGPGADLQPDGAPKPDGPAQDGPAKPDQLLPDILKPDQTVLVPPGTWVTINKTPPVTFKMGSPTGELCKAGKFNETQHSVTLTKTFEIYNTEVTQGEFSTVMGYNPSLNPGCGSKCPVEGVGWHEAMIYCNHLSAAKSLTPCYTNLATPKACTTYMQCNYMSGELCINKKCTLMAIATSYSGQKFYTCPGYRLPTEAEWEYAYRAGTTTAYYNGPNKVCYGKDSRLALIAWYDDNAKSSIHGVGGKAPNAWGLYDMAGNAQEYTQDYYKEDLGKAPTTDPLLTSGTKTTVRGGDWLTYPSGCRAASRWQFSLSGGGNASGFRCVRTLNP